MAIAIPKEFISGFEKLKNLSVAQVDEISTYIHKIPYGTGTKQFEKQLEEKFPDIDTHYLSNTIYSLGSVLNKFDESIEEISIMLTDSLKEEIENVEEGKLEEKINLVLKNLGNLKDTFKAYNLISDNDITYLKSRIYSDIRLLFNEDLSIDHSDKKAVIIHKFKIEAEKNNASKYFYFSMDSNDLLKLKGQINRALKKDEKIRTDHSDVNFIKTTE